MSPVTSIAAEAFGHNAQRWEPPDVSLPDVLCVEVEPEPVMPLPTAEEIAAIEEAARSAGSEAGYQEGYQAGYDAGNELARQRAAVEQEARAVREVEFRANQEAMLTIAVTALEGIAHALSDPLADSVDDLEPELLLLVTTLARRVIMEELQLRPELIVSVLRQALAQLPSRNHPLRIHLNPDDQVMLEAYASSVDEMMTWLPSSTIERGGCLVESGASRIDATLETRLQQTIAAIWGELAPPVVVPAPASPVPPIAMLPEDTP